LTHIRYIRSVLLDYRGTGVTAARPMSMKYSLASHRSTALSRYRRILRYTGFNRYRVVFDGCRQYTGVLVNYRNNNDINTLVAVCLLFTITATR